MPVGLFRWPSCPFRSMCSALPTRLRIGFPDDAADCAAVPEASLVRRLGHQPASPEGAVVTPSGNDATRMALAREPSAYCASVTTAASRSAPSGSGIVGCAVSIASCPASRARQFRQHERGGFAVGVEHQKEVRPVLSHGSDTPDASGWGRASPGSVHRDRTTECPGRYRTLRVAARGSPAETRRPGG